MSLDAAIGGAAPLELGKGWTLGWIGSIAVPPELLRDILLEPDEKRPSHRIWSQHGPTGAYPDQVILAARLRLRALAHAMQEVFHDEAADRAADADEIWLHDNVFRAAAHEPLIVLANGDIGFDPEGWRLRLIELSGSGSQAVSLGVDTT